MRGAKLTFQTQVYRLRRARVSLLLATCIASCLALSGCMQLTIIGSPKSSSTSSSTDSTGFGNGTGIVVSGPIGLAGGIGGNEFDSIAALQIDSEGRLVVGGTSNALPSQVSAAFIARYNSDGSLDTNFAGTGYVLLPGLTSFSWDGWEFSSVAALQIDSVGRIVAAGTESNNSGTEGILWRYNADGSLDTTLGGGDGYVITGDNSVLNNPVGTAGGVGWQADDEFYSLQIDSSGRYVVAGISDDASGNDDLVIWRYNTDGSLDTTLSGGTGYVLAGPSVASWGACGKYCNEKTGSLQIDSSHRYVIASLYTNPSGGIEGGIWRFNSDGSVDTTFGGGAGYVLTGTTGAALASGASENDVFPRGELWVSSVPSAGAMMSIDLR